MRTHEKPILVTGGAGYVGSNIVRKLLDRGASRVMAVNRGRKFPFKEPRVETLSGDCLAISPAFKAAITASDAIVHTVGILFQTGGATYESANYQTFDKLMDVIEGDKKSRTVVLVSAEKGLPFFPGYLAFKRRAEDRLLASTTQKGISAHVLRPGFISNPAIWWHRPLSLAIDLAWQIGEVADRVPFVNRFSPAIFPARSVPIHKVAACASACALADNHEGSTIWTNADLIQFDD